MVALLICLAILLSSNVFAANLDTASDSQPNILNDVEYLKEKYADSLSNSEIDDLLDYHIHDSDFLAHYAEDRDACFEIMENVLLYEITPSVTPFSSQTHYSVPMVAVRQSTTYNCGPASMVQTLIGMRVYAANLSAAQYKTYEQQLASAVGTTESGTAPSRMVTELNKHTGGTNKYILQRMSTGYSETSAEYQVTRSLARSRPPIIKPRTEQLDYYGGLAIAHFISVQEMNTSYDLNYTILVDPHYSNAYFGRHSISNGTFASIMDYREMIYA